MSPGRLLYAVGDIHGRNDLLDQILVMIFEDVKRTPAMKGPPILLFLGDYVDCGLGSKACISRLLQIPSHFETRFLMGAHESAMLRFLEAPMANLAWLSRGGTETLFSYGVAAPSPQASRREIGRAARAFRNALPDEHLEFFRHLEPFVNYGDYLFAHSPLDLPEASSSRWVGRRLRRLGYGAATDHPATIVHGRYPVDSVRCTGDRIAIDTGAYLTGRLSALRLHEYKASVLCTGDASVTSWR